MSPQLIVTKDGSHTVQTGGVTYHSTFGAVQESNHIFIRAGLRSAIGAGSRGVTGAGLSTHHGPIRIFEMGFGTGLNALLSLMEGVASDRAIVYETVEREPLAPEVVRQLNFCQQLQRPDLQKIFEQFHATAWGTPVAVTPGFSLYKVLGDGREYRLREAVDLVYYDAFDPVAQPELWTQEVFENLWKQMTPGAILVTYSCKGSVRRALRDAGFTVEKLPGPPGKREMLRARVTHARGLGELRE